MSFAERVRSTLVFKMTDVEEPIDMIWHRPIAAVVAALMIPLPIQPNHVTWMSLAVGWVASAFFYMTAFGDLPDWGYAAAGVALFMSVIFDCADGQLARAKGGGTRMGRILDGLVDVLVVAPFYILMVFDIGARYGQFAFWFSTFGGLFSWGQILAYDAVKSKYMANALETPPSSDGAETNEELEAEWTAIKASRSWTDIVLFWIYLNGLIRFSRFFAMSDELEIKKSNSPSEIETFKAAHRSTMRLVSWVGLGSHMLPLYMAVIAMAVWPMASYAVQYLFVCVFGLFFVIGIAKSRGMKPVHEGVDS